MTKPAYGGILELMKKGAPPYGLRVENRILVRDPIEGEIVDLIFKMREEKTVIRKIVDYLNTSQAPKRRSVPWNPDTVDRILTRLGAKRVKAVGGWPKGVGHLASQAVNKANKIAHYSVMFPIVDAFRDMGLNYTAIARQLTVDGFKTRQRKEYTAVQVRRIALWRKESNRTT